MSNHKIYFLWTNKQNINLELPVFFRYHRILLYIESELGVGVGGWWEQGGER